MKRQLALGLGLYGLIVLVAAIFWSGLGGPFLFDDIRNLKPLGDHGGIDSLSDLAHFVFSGNAGPLGRPISLLTFVFNGVTWPTDPGPFKYTNLMLHLLNGVLVFTLLRQMAVSVPGRRAAVGVIALGGTAIWLLHPLQLTPVLFVVQRMTELSALFVLAGVIGYIAGRRLSVRRPGAGYALMSCAVGMGGILAVLSKENGVLLPLFILVIETSILRDEASGAPRWLWWRGLFLWLPLVLLAGYIGRAVLNSGTTWALRPFDLPQRLLTEPRVLMDYLRLVILPNVHGMGLFHDDYAASSGLLTPVTTLLSIVAVAGVLVLALLARRRQPVLTFAILWFVAGHALEAGPVNLELYFEHRNYLPLMGPAFGVSWYAVNAPKRLRYAPVCGLLVFIALIASSTWRSSQVWGDFARLASISAAENPRSIRAQQAAAKYWFDHGSPQRAASYLKRAASYHPDNVGLDVQRMFVDCSDGTLNHIDMSDVVSDARRSPYANEVHDGLKTLRDNASRDRCEGLTLDKLIKIERTLLRNPHFGLPKIQRNLYYEIAHVYADKRIIDKTIEAADKAYAAQPSYEIAMQCVVWLLSADMPDDAMGYLEKARRARANRWMPAWRRETEQIDKLETAIKKARLTAQSASTDADPERATLHMN